MVCWAPSSKQLLIGNSDGEVTVYDENGQLLHQIRMAGLQRVIEPENFLKPHIPLAGIDWFE